MKITSQSVAIVAQQLSLCPPLPSVIGPVEFNEFCARWKRLDALLCSGLEQDFVKRCLQHKIRKRPMTVDEQASYQLESQRALRCTVARRLLQESLREFSCHLAESPVLQCFCLFGDFATVIVPGHSQLQRYEYWLPAAEIRAVVLNAVQQAQGVDAPQMLDLQQPVSLETVWVDSTCAETNIHAEQRDGLIVDWALPQITQTDQALLHDGIERWQTAYGPTAIRRVVTDRGFDGPTSRADLASANLENGMCPRSPRQLIKRLEDPAFRAQQRRRAQTEGRIAIVKQTFLDGHLQTKGYAHHVTEVNWVILAHNLWVLARLPVASKYSKHLLAKHLLAA